MLERGELGERQVAEHVRRCGDGERHLLAAKAAERGHAKVTQQEIAGRVTGKALGLQGRDGDRLALAEGRTPAAGGGFGEQQLGRREARQLLDRAVEGARAGNLGDQELAGRDVADRQPEGRGLLSLPGHDGGQVVGPLRLQHRVLEDRAGRHHPRHFPLDDVLGEAGVFHLVADGDPIPLRNQASDIALDGMVRYAAHRHPLAILIEVPAGER